MSDTPTVEVSWGEFVDKLTILEIKQQRLRAPDALANVRAELSTMQQVLDRLPPPPPSLAALKQRLRAVNEALWQIEDDIRAKEAAKAFDAQFVELARSVYRSNDQRAAIKREINTLMKSRLVEEKQYTSYGS